MGKGERKSRESSVAFFFPLSFPRLSFIPLILLNADY